MSGTIQMPSDIPNSSATFLSHLLFLMFLKNLPGYMWNHFVKQQTMHISSLSAAQKAQQKAIT